MGNWEMAVNLVFNLPYLEYFYILEYIGIIHPRNISFFVSPHFNSRAESCMLIMGINSVLLCSVTLLMSSCFNTVINFACKPDNEKNLFQLFLVI